MDFTQETLFESVWRNQGASSHVEIYHKTKNCKKVLWISNMRKTRLGAAIAANLKPCKVCYPEF